MNFLKFESLKRKPADRGDAEPEEDMLAKRKKIRQQPEQTETAFIAMQNV